MRFSWWSRSTLWSYRFWYFVLWSVGKNVKDVFLPSLGQKIHQNDTHLPDNTLTKTLKTVMYVNVHTLLTNYESQSQNKLIHREIRVCLQFLNQQCEEFSLLPIKVIWIRRQHMKIESQCKHLTFNDWDYRLRSP